MKEKMNDKKNDKKFDQKIYFGKTEISKQRKPFLIAELGLNHNRDLEIGKRMISKAASCGANAVKLQSYSTEKFIRPNNPKIKNLYEIFKGLELTFENHEVLKRSAQNEGVEFFSTPLSVDWVQKLKRLDAPAIKIASGDLQNFQLLLETMNQKKAWPLIISTGAAKFSEIINTADILQNKKKFDVIFMHCVSLYPTPIEKVNLGRMTRIENELGCLVGFSDHTEKNWAAFAAVAAGAVVIEKHFTLDRNMLGPDQKLSCEPSQFSLLREKINMAYEMTQGEADSWPQEFEADFYGKRSLYKTNDGLMAMRPRDPDFPKDSEFPFKIYE